MARIGALAYMKAKVCLRWMQGRSADADMHSMSHDMSMSAHPRGSCVGKCWRDAFEAGL